MGNLEEVWKRLLPDLGVQGHRTQAEVLRELEGLGAHPEAQDERRPHDETPAPWVSFVASSTHLWRRRSKASS